MKLVPAIGSAPVYAWLGKAVELECSETGAVINDTTHSLIRDKIAVGEIEVV